MKQYLTSIARFISAFFNPLLMMGMVAGVFGWVTGHWYTVAALVGAVIVLMVFIILAVISGMVTDIDLSRRQQRPWFVFSAVGVVGLTGLLRDVVFWPYYMTILIWLLLFGAITLRWKISGHTGVATLAIIFFTMLTQGSAWPLFGLIPVIAWSRVHLGRHTIAQTIAGTLLSLAVAGSSWYLLS